MPIICNIYSLKDCLTIFAKYQKISIIALSILHEQTTAKASNKLVG